MISRFSLVVFKWHHGGEGVNFNVRDNTTIIYEKTHEKSSARNGSRCHACATQSPKISWKPTPMFWTTSNSSDKNYSEFWTFGTNVPLSPRKSRQCRAKANFSFQFQENASQPGNVRLGQRSNTAVSFSPVSFSCIHANSNLTASADKSQSRWIVLINTSQKARIYETRTQGRVV